MEECGFFIDVDNPYIGASPDGVVSCACCGDGMVSLKLKYDNYTEAKVIII